MYLTLMLVFAFAVAKAVAFAVAFAVASAVAEAVSSVIFEAVAGAERDFLSQRNPGSACAGEVGGI